MLRLIMALLVILPISSYAACTAETFEYKILQRGDDTVISYAGTGGARELVDTDGLLSVMALYRSWQTQQTDIISVQEINLLNSSLARLENKLTNSPITAASIANLRRSFPRGETVRFSRVQQSVQDFLAPIYRQARTTVMQGGPGPMAHTYKFTHPTGGPYDLPLCAQTGINGRCALGTSLHPQCHQIWKDFCGEPVSADRMTNGAALVTEAPKICHVINLDQLNQGSRRSDAAASAVEQ